MTATLGLMIAAVFALAALPGLWWARPRRRAHKGIRHLDRATRERYTRAWAEVERRFPRAPARSVHDADRLLADLTRARGYPADFGERLAALSERHGRTVEDYRSAHDVSARVPDDAPMTDELRTALVHYREMLAALLLDDTRHRARA